MYAGLARMAASQLHRREKMSSSGRSASRMTHNSPETPPTTPQLRAQIIMSIARIAKTDYSLTSTNSAQKSLRVTNLGLGQYADDWFYACCPEPARGSHLYPLHWSHRRFAMWISSNP